MRPTRQWEILMHWKLAAEEDLLIPWSLVHSPPNSISMFIMYSLMSHLVRLKTRFQARHNLTIAQCLPQKLFDCILMF